MTITQPYTNHSNPNNDLRIVVCGEPTNIAPPSETFEAKLQVQFPGMMTQIGFLNRSQLWIRASDFYQR